MDVRFCTICGREEWWKILPSNPLYKVSTLGRVMRVVGGSGATCGHILSSYPSSNRRGDLQVVLSRNSKRTLRLVSNVVAETFIGPRPLGMQVNHIDLNFLHNCEGNLEYVTPKENSLHAARHGHGFYSGERNPASKLTQKDVDEIREAYGHPKVKLKELVMWYGVSRVLIIKIVRNELWKQRRK